MKRIKETELVAVIKRNALSYFFLIQFPGTVKYSKEAFQHFFLFISVWASLLAFYWCVTHPRRTEGLKEVATTLVHLQDRKGAIQRSGPETLRLLSEVFQKWWTSAEGCVVLPCLCCIVAFLRQACGSPGVSLLDSISWGNHSIRNQTGKFGMCEIFKFQNYCLNQVT